ncbi:MAG: hypothetical protein ABI542_05425 [Gemmatimonadota bacterium]
MKGRLAAGFGGAQAPAVRMQLRRHKAVRWGRVVAAVVAVVLLEVAMRV